MLGNSDKTKEINNIMILILIEIEEKRIQYESMFGNEWNSQFVFTLNGNVVVF